MLAFNCPVNSVSFGQVSTALLRECYESKKDVCVLPIGDKIDISAQKEDTDFFQWVNGEDFFPVNSPLNILGTWDLSNFSKQFPPVNC